ncbi:MAG: OmpH family outer membrane protein [Bacteroidales bacterium]|nr:OmpH family outer membrane protein [Bacteroidales bacterium]
MKKIINFIVVIALVCFINVANGQKKFGHINSNDLLEKMPGRDSAKTKIEKYTKELQTQYKNMQTELETKYNDYVANEGKMTELIKKTRMDELKTMQDRIEDFQKNAQEEMQKKEKELLEPIINKAKKAIEDVATENKYDYIFDSGIGFLLYSTPGDDILPLVKKKLGIK